MSRIRQLMVSPVFVIILSQDQLVVTLTAGESVAITIDARGKDLSSPP